MFFSRKEKTTKLFKTEKKEDEAKNCFVAALAKIILCFANWQKIVTTSQNSETSAITRTINDLRNKLHINEAIYL